LWPTVASGSAAATRVDAKAGAINDMEPAAMNLRRPIWFGIFTSLLLVLVAAAYRQQFVSCSIGCVVASRRTIAPVSLRPGHRPAGAAVHGWWMATSQGHPFQARMNCLFVRRITIRMVVVAVSKSRQSDRAALSEAR
jgi:hypothetical protein